MKRYSLAACAALLLVATGQAVQAGTIEAFNHTRWAINSFSVDGQPGIDIIGPFQGGGGGCCYRAPTKWHSGMTVKVNWETGAGDMDGFPGFGDDAKYLVWEKKMKALSRQHSKVVPMPDYTGQDTCGITVHFLPCDDIKVTTSCVVYGNPGHPVTDPINMPEPTVCPK